MKPGTDYSNGTSKRPSRIPAFASIDEEAAFWDSHDSSDFEDEFEDTPNVRFVPVDAGMAAITIVFAPETLAALRERARDAGTAPETLAHDWILERLGAR